MKILLHICCSNCALFPYKLLKDEGHDFTGFWFNPNIHPQEEYNCRLDSLKRLAREWNFEVQYADDYRPDEYFSMFEGSSLSMDPVSGRLSEDSVPPFPERCRSCYELRLEKTAACAKEQGFEAFSTTLLISPYQDFDGIVSAGETLADKYNVRFHAKDYRPYFREAMNLAKEMGLYRQKYCGCIFSREERNKRNRSNGVME